MKNTQQGGAIVEFALILPLLLLLGMITTEFGRAIYQYNTIVKSLRGAARYLSIQTPSTHVTETKNLVVFGNVSGTGSAVTPGLTISLVDTPTWQTTGSVPLINTVTITVSGYTFNPMFKGAFGVALGPLTYGDISVTMRSQL